jgi:L-seryl-tRNA(Ser) seleniumtransferase
VDKLLSLEEGDALVAAFGHPLTVNAVRHTLSEIRTAYKDVSLDAIPSLNVILKRTEETLADWVNPSLQPVINATGVVIHTNLGRAPLSRETIRAMQAVSAGYSNLEYDLGKGRRGSRYLHAEELLVRLTGAEAALVVNNNAAALMLALAALARRRRALISRTQLVEIGGGFRIPEVMKQSGAKLYEIGATNRVHLKDYDKAIKDQSIALVMRAHRSNFRLEGFTGEPAVEEVIALAHDAGLPFLDDLGSGSLLDTAAFGLGHEPTVQEALAAGADLVCFSGDKLLGGPQAGVIVGRKDLIAKLRKHPMARAVRADKTALAGLSATLLHYLKNEAVEKIPVWQMIAARPDALKTAVAGWIDELGTGSIIKGASTVGGGSLPGETLPTFLLALDIPHPDRVLALLRAAATPVIARLEDDRAVFDPRTVFPEQEKQFLAVLKQTLQKVPVS